MKYRNSVEPGGGNAGNTFGVVVIFCHAIPGDAEHQQVESGPGRHLVGHVSLTKCSPVGGRILARDIDHRPTIQAEFVRESVLV